MFIGRPSELIFPVDNLITAQISGLLLFGPFLCVVFPHLLGLSLHYCEGHSTLVARSLESDRQGLNFRVTIHPGFPRTEEFHGDAGLVSGHFWANQTVGHPRPLLLTSCVN